MEDPKRSWWLILAIFVLIGMIVLALIYLMDSDSDGIVEKTITTPTYTLH